MKKRTITINDKKNSVKRLLSKRALACEAAIIPNKNVMPIGKRGAFSTIFVLLCIILYEGLLRLSIFDTDIVFYPIEFNHANAFNIYYVFFRFKGSSFLPVGNYTVGEGRADTY